MAQLLNIQKEGNTWMVRLVEQQPGAGAQSRAPAAQAQEVFVGAEEHIYFRADPKTSGLIERTRRALGKLVDGRISRSQESTAVTPAGAQGAAEQRLIDAICEALVQDDRLPPL